MIAAENPRGTPAFQGLVNDPPTSEEQFKSLWKLYFLTLLTAYLRRHRDGSKQQNTVASEVIKTLEENGLLDRSDTLNNLIQSLKSAYDYLRKQIPSVEASVTDPNSGAKFTGKILLTEPSNEERKQGFISADELLKKVNQALSEYNITIWLLIDRLDVAFEESSQLESNALRSLFRVYLDCIHLSRFSLKIFLRDDIWNRITNEGFREASHITRALTISWSAQSLLNLVVRRLVHNTAVCGDYEVTKVDVLKDFALQSEFFYRVFPPKVELGRQPKTLDWMLSRVADASRKTAPRELIHLLTVARERQLQRYELGHAPPPNNNLFDRAAIKDALPQVSKVRFEQTLLAEYPALKKDLKALEGQKTEQTVKSLSKHWVCDVKKAGEIAERLTDIGFFEKIGLAETPAFRIPFIYRSALKLIQGKAQAQ